MRLTFGGLVLFAMLGMPSGLALSQSSATMSDDEVRQAIIAQSIASYPGNCPCPYNRASNGSRCGKRSAWSKPGGYSPLCYPDDVTDAMVERFRQLGYGQ